MGERLLDDRAGRGASGVLRLAAALVAGAIALGPSAVPAQAHTYLQSSDPPVGATLAQAPAQVRLTFVDEVEPQFATATLAVEDQIARQLDTRVEDQAVVAVLPPEPATTAEGLQTWTVAYRIVSSDGHPVTGAVPFTVSAAADAAEITATPPAPSTTGKPPQTLSPGGSEADPTTPFPRTSVALLSALTLIGILAVGLRARGAASAPHGRRGRGSHDAGWPLGVSGARAVAAAALLLVAPVGAAGALVLTAGAGAIDAGLLVLRALHDAAAVLTVGLLVLVAAVLPPDPGSTGEELGTVRRRALRVAAVCGGVWAVSGAVAVVLTYVDVAGPGAPDPGSGVLNFATDPGLGGRLVLAVVLVVVVVVMAARARRTSTAGGSAAVAGTALVLAAAKGHGSQASEVAMAVQAVHVLGASAWVGGLAGLVLLRRDFAERFIVVAHRYSTLAGWSFAAVLASGLAGAALRLESWAALATAYGALMLAKSAALIVLGIAGWHQRARILATAERNGDRHRFARLAVGELAVMAVAVGMAATLSGTPPPAATRAVGGPTSTPLVQLLPPPNLGTWFTQWDLSWGWLALAVMAGGGYLSFVVSARRSGRAWPLMRSVAWATGWSFVVVATGGAPAVYGGAVLWMHVLASMVLAAVAPTLFVLARPLALVATVVPARADGSRGLVEWGQHLRSWWVAHPLGRPGPVLLLYTVVLGAVVLGVVPRFAAPSPAVHPGAAWSLLAAGCTLAWAVRRTFSASEANIWRRVAVVLGVASAHAVLGVMLMAGAEVGASGWTPVIQTAWAPDLVVDQQRAGQVVWLVGAGAVIALALVVTSTVATAGGNSASPAGPAAPADVAGGPAPQVPHPRPPVVTRREVLLGAAGAAGAVVTARTLLVPQPASGAPAGARVAPSASVVDRLEDLRRSSGTGRTVTAHLTARPVELDLGGRVVSTWAYGTSAEPLRCTAGDELSVDLTNELPEPTTIHWHGLQLRNDMDGVPHLTQDPVAPGERRRYLFTASHPGTYWYHPHMGMQRDRGLFAPLIIEDPQERGDYDVEFVVVIDDWIDGAGSTPDDVLRVLESSAMGEMAATYSAPALDGVIRPDWQRWEYDVPPRLAEPPPGTVALPMPGWLAGEVRYPFHLVNGRLPSAPHTFSARSGQRARLRLINAAGTTTYRVALGGHRLTVTHTDGFPVDPVTVDTLQIAPGERYDLMVRLGDGAFPLAAVAEGQDVQALGVIRTGSGPTPPPDAQPAELSGRLLRLTDLVAAPAVRLPRSAPDVQHRLYLTGAMDFLSWHINAERYDHRRPFRGITPLPVREGDHVRLSMINQTPMYHPMHVHGHTFQVHAVGTTDGEPPAGLVHGPRKDTVLVPPGQRMDVDLAADNPGQWLTHCHNSVHMATGMATVLSYGR